MAELNEYIRVFADWLEVPPMVVVAVMFPVLVLGVIWHTGSTYPLRARIWRLLISESDNSDGAVRHLMRDREALVEFRYFFGIGARTSRDIERLKRWAADGDGDDDLSAAAACGRHFDVQRCRVNRPRVLMTVALFVLAIVLYVSAVSTAVVASGRAILVCLKDSPQWFWLTASEAERTGPLHWYRTTFDGVAAIRYTAEDCAAYRVFRGPNTKDEVGKICMGFADPDLREFVESGLRKQRAFLGILVALLCWLNFVTLRGLWRRRAAVRLHNRLPLYDHPLAAMPVAPHREARRATVVRDRIDALLSRLRFKVRRG